MCLSLKWQLMSLAGEQTGYENAQGEEWEGQGESVPCVPEELFSRSWDLHDLMAEQVSLLESVFSHVLPGVAVLACCGEIRPKLMTLMVMRQHSLSAGLHRQARRGPDLCLFLFLSPWIFSHLCKPLLSISRSPPFSLDLSPATLWQAASEQTSRHAKPFTNAFTFQALFCHSSILPLQCSYVCLEARIEIWNQNWLWPWFTHYWSYEQIFLVTFLFYIYSILLCHNHQIRYTT